MKRNNKGQEIQVCLVFFPLYYSLLYTSQGPFLYHVCNKQIPSVTFLFILVIIEFELFNFLGKMSLLLLFGRGISALHSAEKNDPNKSFYRYLKIKGLIQSEEHQRSLYHLKQGLMA